MKLILKIGALVKFSGTVTFAELLIEHNMSLVGFGFLWRPQAWLGHLGGLSHVSIGLYSAASIDYNVIPCQG